MLKMSKIEFLNCNVIDNIGFYLLFNLKNIYRNQLN